jgi:tetratricopeptide (TPR) repeat protein
MKRFFTGPGLLSAHKKHIFTVYGLSCFCFFQLLPFLKNHKTILLMTIRHLSFPDQQDLDFFSDLPRRLRKMPLTATEKLVEQRLQAAESHQNKKGIASAANNLGMIWLKKGDYNKALDYFLKIIKRAQRTG